MNKESSAHLVRLSWGLKSRIGCQVEPVAHNILDPEGLILLSISLSCRADGNAVPNVPAHVSTVVNQVKARLVYLKRPGKYGPSATHRAARDFNLRVERLADVLGVHARKGANTGNGVTS